jgi:5-keto 4-deoxyuronate isomerase
VMPPPGRVTARQAREHIVSFWHMAGENKEFSEMDPVSIGELR